MKLILLMICLSMNVLAADGLVVNQYKYPGKTGGLDPSSLKEPQKRELLKLFEMTLRAIEQRHAAVSRIKKLHSDGTMTMWDLTAIYPFDPFKAGVDFGFSTQKGQEDIMVGLIFTDDQDTSKMDIKAYSKDFQMANDWAKKTFESYVTEFGLSNIQYRARALKIGEN